MDTIVKSYRLYINNESMPRVIHVQATKTPGIFENRTAYYQAKREGRRWIGSWLRWKTPNEKVVRKSSMKLLEPVLKTGRRQMNFFIDKANAKKLPRGEPRHRLINQLLAAHFIQLEPLPLHPDYPANVACLETSVDSPI